MFLTGKILKRYTEYLVETLKLLKLYKINSYSYEHFLI